MKSPEFAPNAKCPRFPASNEEFSKIHHEHAFKKRKALL
jgi:hypothetical protein